MKEEELEKQNTVDIRSYNGSITEEFLKVINYLKFEFGNLTNLSADSVIEPELRKLMSMRLKHTSRALDVLSRRVMHEATSDLIRR